MKPIRRLGATLAIGTLVLNLLAPLALAPAAHAAELPATLMNGTFSGTLISDGGGAYQVFQLPYRAGQGPVVLHFTFSPADPVAAKAVGLKVYSNGKLLDTAQEVNHSYSLTDTKERNEKEFRAGTPGNELLVLQVDTDQHKAGTGKPEVVDGPYTVQIYSYLPHTAVNWTLGISGLAQVPTSPTTAMVQSSAQ